MTDIWCFTCSHELRQNITGGYAHLDPDDDQHCDCIEEELECAP